MAELAISDLRGTNTAAPRPDVLRYLAGLPHLGLSDTGRRNVAARFGLSADELQAALTTAANRKGGHGEPD